MKKILFGVLLGAAAMYYLDPVAGPDRRRKLSGSWADQKDTVLDAARTTASTVTSVSQGIGARVSEPGSEAQTNGKVLSESSPPKGGGKT
ncbi:MAG TPA: YtxH domain-containing protein [Candidatus Dormibacteraeota bacterium]|nr:YtxH domain-containing protein [Candidatus Dormibacteraeota bacterium]